MTNFNPNSTATSGLEWLATRELPRPLQSGKGIGASMTSTATETIPTLSAYLFPTGAALVGVDLYDATDVTATVFGGSALPGHDFAHGNDWWTTGDGGSTFQAYPSGDTGHTFVNMSCHEGMSSTDIQSTVTASGQWIRFLPSGADDHSRVMFSTGSPPTWKKVTDGTNGNDPTSDRVGWIEVVVAAKSQNGASQTIDGVLQISGTQYASAEGPTLISGSWQRYVFHYWVNPATGRQWYNSGITTFYSSGVNGFGVQVVGKSPTNTYIAAVNLVFRALPEKRKAIGYTSVSAQGWADFTLLSPTDGSTASWAKASGHTYLAAFYLPSGGVCTLNGLDQASLVDQPDGALTGWAGADQPMTTNTEVPSAAATASTWAASVYLTRNDAAISVDGQPYVVAATINVAAGDGTDGQDMPAHATATYGLINLAIRLTGNVPTADLTVGIHATSGGALVGGTGTIHPADVPNDGLYHLVQVRLSSGAALASGTAYEIRFSTTSPSPGTWPVAYIDTLSTAAAAIGLGGNAYLDGTTAPTITALTSAGTVPTAPGSLTVTVGNKTLSPSPPGGPAILHYAAVDWASTALGGNFGQYELQRSDDNTTWATIAIITTESASNFSDVECLRNAIQYYRVRVVRKDGAASDWTT